MNRIGGGGTQPGAVQHHSFTILFGVLPTFQHQLEPHQFEWWCVDRFLVRWCLEPLAMASAIGAHTWGPCSRAKLALSASMGQWVFFAPHPQQKLEWRPSPKRSTCARSGVRALVPSIIINCKDRTRGKLSGKRKKNVLCDLNYVVRVRVVSWPSDHISSLICNFSSEKGTGNTKSTFKSWLVPLLMYSVCQGTWPSGLLRNFATSSL